MKKLFSLLMLVVAMLSLTACPELMPDSEELLEFEVTEYSIPSEGGQIEIHFMSLVDWTVTSDVAWLTFSPSSGAASEQEAVITVTVDPNNSSQRTAQLTVSSVFDDVIIVVTQAGKDETPEPEVPDTPDNPDTPDVPQDWLLCRTTDYGNTWENFEFTSYEDGMLKILPCVSIVCSAAQKPVLRYIRCIRRIWCDRYVWSVRIIRCIRHLRLRSLILTCLSHDNDHIIEY